MGRVGGDWSWGEGREWWGLELRGGMGRVGGDWSWGEGEDGESGWGLELRRGERMGRVGGDGIWGEGREGESGWGLELGRERMGSGWGWSWREAREEDNGESGWGLELMRGKGGREWGVGGAGAEGRRGRGGVGGVWRCVGGEWGGLELRGEWVGAGAEERWRWEWGLKLRRGIGWRKGWQLPQAVKETLEPQRSNYEFELKVPGHHVFNIRSDFCKELNFLRQQSHLLLIE